MREIFNVVDVKNECIKLDVAKFVMKRRLECLLIEYKNDFNLIIKDENLSFS